MVDFDKIQPQRKTNKYFIGSLVRVLVEKVQQRK